MTWLLSFASALIMAVVGAVALGVLADRWTVWFRVTSAEGAAGYFVLLYGILGAIGGFVVGLICARYAVQGTDARFLLGLQLGTAWVLGIVGVLAVITYTVADHPPRLNGQPLVLDVEIRIPTGTPQPATPGFQSMVTLENGLGKTTSWTQVPWDRVREENGQQILPFSLALRSSSARRTLLIQWLNDAWLTVAMPLRSKPTRADFEWSEWLEARPSNPAQAASGAPPAPLAQVRYRVGIVPPRPPPRSAAELAQEREAAMAAQLAALPADAPLQDRLPFTRHGVEGRLQTAALEGIRSRNNFAAEFAALVVDDDAELAAETLRLVSRLPGPGEPLLDPVAACGRDLLQRLERVLRTTEEEDPGYAWAAGISIRFSGWMDAVFHLRKQAGGDFTPELRAILIAARKRPDSHALRQDVVRVASYYLREWAGDAPLPTDPPPR